MPARNATQRTAFVILDYCGGRQTDRLFDRIARLNPGARIMLLDNGSPHNQARRATHRNAVNSYVGGGICDSIKLAEAAGAEYLFFCVNDVSLAGRLVITDFEAMMDADERVVMVSCSLTPDSIQAPLFHWMRQRPTGGARQVRHADLICCLMRLSFIESFGGFPRSKGGWGYCEEFAFHAREQGRKILINDRCAIRHVRGYNTIATLDGEVVEKEQEACAIYDGRYGSYDRLRAVFDELFCDEEASVAIPPSAKTRRWDLARLHFRQWRHDARLWCRKRARKTRRSLSRRLGLLPAPP